MNEEEAETTEEANTLLAPVSGKTGGQDTTELCPGEASKKGALKRERGRGKKGMPSRWASTSQRQPA